MEKARVGLGVEFLLRVEKEVSLSNRSLRKMQSPRGLPAHQGETLVGTVKDGKGMF